MAQNIVYLTNTQTFVNGQPVSDLKSLSGHLKIILGNDLTYLTVFEINNPLDWNRDKVLAEAKIKFPIKIDNQSFDWKKVKIQDKWFVQIIAIDADYFQSLKTKLQSQNLIIDFIVPVAILLSGRFLNSNYQFFEYDREEKFGFVAADGLVWLTSNHSIDDQWLNYVRQIIPDIDQNITKIDLIKNNPSKIIQNWVMGWGGDEKYLGIIPDSKYFVQKPTTPKKSLTRPLFLGLLLAISIGVFVFINHQQQGSQPLIAHSPPTVIISPTTAPLPTPTISFSTLKLKIENASKLPGQANKLKSKLSNLNFNQITTTNSSQVATQSVIMVKNNVDKNVLDQLRSQYLPDIKIGDTLSGSEIIDILIRIGKLDYAKYQ